MARKDNKASLDNQVQRVTKVRKGRQDRTAQKDLQAPLAKMARKDNKASLDNQVQRVTKVRKGRQDRTAQKDQRAPLARTGKKDLTVTKGQKD